MCQIRVPIKKYQNRASIAALVGLLFGAGIPLYGFTTGRWACPFGDHLAHKTIFSLLSGVIGALLLGNLAAVALILVAKRRKLSSRNARNNKR